MGEHSLGFRGSFATLAARGSRCSLSAMFALAILLGATRVACAEPIDDFSSDAPEFDNLLDTEGINYLDVFEASDPTTVTPGAVDELGEDGDDLSLIPEPATLVMLGLATLLLFLWRRKW